MQQPNVLLITCDQLNPAVMSCYGGPVPTPHLASLASEGVCFTQATTPFPACSPARASLVTGQFPHTHRIVHNVLRRDYPMVDSPATEEGIKATDLTLDKLLFDRGYSTHHYGKWHLLDDDLPYFSDMFTEHDGYAKGMEPLFQQVAQTDRNEWMDWCGWKLPIQRSKAFQAAAKKAKDQLKDHMYSDIVGKIGKLNFTVDQTFDAMVAQRTMDRLRTYAKEEQGEGRPFMVTCSFQMPQTPNAAPSPYYEMFNPAKIKLPRNQYCEALFQPDFSRTAADAIGERGLREFLRVYYAAVKLIDDQVGTLLRCLQEEGLDNDTIVVFTADHGDMTGGHGMIWQSTTAFYEEVVKVPLIMKYPKVLQPQRSELPMCLTDMLPTLLACTGVSIPPTVEGRNMLPFLTGEIALNQASPYTFSERIPPNPQHTRGWLPMNQACYMVRGRGYKYIAYADGHRFLYDLVRDPGEVRNLAYAQEHALALQEMRQALDLWKSSQLQRKPNI
jgi:arylsulfatase A-like enzyme